MWRGKWVSARLCPFLRCLKHGIQLFPLFERCHVLNLRLHFRRPWALLAWKAVVESVSAVVGGERVKIPNWQNVKRKSPIAADKAYYTYSSIMPSTFYIRPVYPFHIWEGVLKHHERNALLRDLYRIVPWVTLFLRSISQPQITMSQRLSYRLTHLSNSTVCCTPLVNLELSWGT